MRPAIFSAPRRPYEADRAAPFGALDEDGPGAEVVLEMLGAGLAGLGDAEAADVGDSEQGTVAGGEGGVAGTSAAADGTSSARYGTSTVCTRRSLVTNRKPFRTLAIRGKA